MTHEVNVAEASRVGLDGQEIKTRQCLVNEVLTTNWPSQRTVNNESIRIHISSEKPKLIIFDLRNAGDDSVAEFNATIAVFSLSHDH